jgi:pyruvate formate lyase activating enzyme
VAAAVPPPPRTGRVFDIKRFSTHDGPGIRSTVFFTGCPLRCAWCHNPEAFALHPLRDAPNVREHTVAELIRELERDVPYYDRSGGGVTLSGGEPLVQAPFVMDLLRACRKRELHSALDTCGMVDPAALSAAAGLTDLILYDLKLIDPAAHAEWTGADNRRILENLRLLETLDVPVWIRLPIIPGASDSDAHLEAVIALLAPTRFRRVSILPYHRIAEAKYQRLGLTNRMAGAAPPPPELLDRFRARLSAAGFTPHLGR